MAVHGGCACGAVRYELARDELPTVYCCHCRDCQSRSGSAFAEAAIVGANELKVTGPLVTINITLPSGRTSDQRTCGSCAGRIFSVLEKYPGKLVLFAGTLDDSDSIVPVAHIHAGRKQPWVKLPDDVPVYQEGPSPEFLQLVGYA